MAQRMIDEWQLAVLKVQLDLSARSPDVITELVGYPGGEARTMWSQTFQLHQFGLDVEIPHWLRVPDELRDAVANTLATDLKGEAALWLRLVPPYGYLGAVPWEAALSEATGLSVLRVPDRLPVPTDFGRKWRAAIAISAAPGSVWAAPYVAALVREWQHSVQADVEVDVFADAGTSSELRNVGDLGPDVRVHDPFDAPAASRQRQSSMSSESRRAPSGLPTGQLWADWIAAGLGGRAVHALHLVLNGAFDGDRPLLAVAPDPAEPTTTTNCAYVSASAILELADAVGSAALSFSSPPDNNPDNNADNAVRMIADRVGQQRPGATIYSSIEADPEARALANAHAFVADRTGQLKPPQHPSLFAYVQPEHVQASIEHGWLQAFSELTDTSAEPASPSPSSAALESFYADADSVPTWVASWDRYLGAQSAELAQQANSLAPTAPFKEAYNRGAAAALDELRAILDKHSGAS
jgi:hypothetical protein